MKSKLSYLTLGFALLALTLGAGIVAAQGPTGGTSPRAPLGTGFTYQGQLKSSGSPVNAVCDFQFGLYDAATLGSQIGMTQTAAISVTNGLFTTNLDYGGSAFDGNRRWLGIAVRCPTGSGSYTTLSPRQELSATPYALYSNNANLLDNLDSTAFATAGHNHDTAYWKLVGNGGTTTSNLLGTTDNMTLTLAVSNTAALRLAPHAISPNLIGGYNGNDVTSGVHGATISGGGASGQINRVTDEFGTVGGGNSNQAGNNSGTTSDAAFATVGGGQNNQAVGANATVAGGNANIAAQAHTTIAGGQGNNALAPHAAVGGGQLNNAAGQWSTVPGGANNLAAGNYSFAAGLLANANLNGCFVWSDSIGVPTNCMNQDQFAVGASGGAVFWSTPLRAAGPGVILPPGAAAWAPASDRNLKENLVAVNGREVLARLATVPISNYNLKSQDASIRHIGPMAQDFYAAFGLGDDNLHISTIDADGVALAAIQGLYEMAQEQDARIAALETRVSALEKQNSDLQARLSALEQQAAKSQPNSNLPIWLLGAAALLGIVYHRYRANGGAR